jgi:cytoskeleton protein RodZ
VSKLTTEQQEQLSSLGLYLQSVRKEQGRTVDDVATQIFIRPALLQALEAGNGEELPEPVFIQGFIRRYGDALGLDGQEISRQFEPTPVSVLPDPAAAQGGMDGVVSKQTQHKLKVVAPAEPRRSSQGTAYSGAGLFVGGLVLLAIAGGGLWALLGQGGDRPSLNLARPDDAPESVEPETDTAADEAEPAPAATEPEPVAPVTVAVSLTGDSWLQVTADGEEVYEGILTSGSEETWTAETELVISSGNAGAVQLSYNGTDQVPMGEPGTVEERTFTPDDTGAAP